MEQLELRTLLSVDYVLAADSLDQQMVTMQKRLTDALSFFQTGATSSIPIVGDQLGQAAIIVSGFRDEFREAIEVFGTTSPTVSQLQTSLAAQLGPFLGDQGIDGVHVSKVGSITTVEMILQGSAVVAGVDIGFATGLPSLPIKFTANGSLEVSVGFALEVAFTIDDSTGAVALVDGTRNLTGVTAPDASHPLVDNDADLALFVSAGPSSDFNAKAVFGFVEGFATLLPGEANGLYATVLVSDLLGTPSIRIDGSADANLQLAGSFAGTSDDFPGISTDFHFHWGLSSADPSFEPPTVAFDNVSLTFGTFLSNVLRPSLEPIKDALDPISPVLDLLATKVPGISSLSEAGGAGPITFVDLAVLGSNVTGNGPLGELAGKITNLLAKIDSIQIGSNISLPLGGFDLNSTTNGDLRSSVIAGDFKDLSLSSLSPLSAANLNNLAQSASQSLNDLIDDLAISDDLKSELHGLNALKSQNGFQIAFPILNDPAGVVFNMLLGRDADLFFFQADINEENSLKLDGSLATGLSFAGQSIDFFGHVDIDTHLRFGYDTFGLRQLIANLAAGDASNIVSDITDGFYVNSDSYFKMAGAIGVEVDFPVGDAISIDATGGISTQNNGLDPVHVYIEDPNADGKLRFNEFHLDDNGQPAAFLATGALTAELNIEVGFPDPAPNKHFNITRAELLRFATLTPQNLASQPDANGEITLFLGTNAHQRAVGQNQDDGDEKFIIEHLRTNPNGSEDIKVRAFGINQEIKNVRKIKATDQVGTLTIIVQPGVTSDVDFDGGQGAAFLTYLGSGIANLTGGALASELIGGSGPSILTGGAGDDTIILGSNTNTVDAAGGHNTVILSAPIYQPSTISGGTGFNNELKIIANATTTGITAFPVGSAVDVGIINGFGQIPVHLSFSHFDTVTIDASFSPTDFSLGDLAAAGVELLTLNMTTPYQSARQFDLDTRIANGTADVTIRDYVVPEGSGAEIINATTGLTTRLLGFHSDDTLTLRHHGGSITAEPLEFTSGHFVFDTSARAGNVPDVINITTPARIDGHLILKELFRDVLITLTDYSSFLIKGDIAADQLNLNVAAATNGANTIDIDANSVHGELNVYLLGAATAINQVTLSRAGLQADVSIFGQNTTSSLLLGTGELALIRHDVFASNVQLTVDNDHSRLASILTLDSTSFGTWNIPTLSVTPQLVFNNLLRGMTVHAGAGDRFQLDVTPANITSLAIDNRSMISQDSVYTSNWSVPLRLDGNFSFYAGRVLHRDGTVERIKRLANVHSEVTFDYFFIESIFSTLYPSGPSEVIFDGDLDPPGAQYSIYGAGGLRPFNLVHNETVGLSVKVGGYSQDDQFYIYMPGATVEANLRSGPDATFYLDGQARLTGTNPTAPNEINIQARYGSTTMTPLGDFNSLLNMFNDVYILGAMPQDSLTVNVPTNVVISPAIQHNHNLAINPNNYVEVVVPEGQVISWESGDRPFGFPFKNVDAVSWDQFYATGTGHGEPPNPFGDLPYGLVIPSASGPIEVNYFESSIVNGVTVVRETKIGGFARYWSVDATPEAANNAVRLNASQLRGDFNFNIAPPDYDFVRRFATQSLPQAITQNASYAAPFWTWGGAGSDSTRIAFGQSDITLSHVNPELTVDIDGGSSPFDYRTTPNQGNLHNQVVSAYSKTSLNVGDGVLANLRGNVTADQVQLEVDDRFGTQQNIIGMTSSEISWFDTDNTRTSLGVTQLRNNLILTGSTVDHFAIESTPELFEDDVIERGPTSNTLIVDVPEIVTIRNFAPAVVGFASPDVYLMGHRANQPLNVLGNLDLFVGRRLRTDGVVEAIGDLSGVTEFSGATAVHRVNYTYTGSGRGQLVYDGSSSTTAVRAASIQTDVSQTGRGALHFGYADFTQEIFFPTNSLNALTFGGNTNFSIYAPIRGFERRQLSGYGIEFESTTTAAISYFTNPLQAALEIDQVSIFSHRGPLSVTGRGEGTRVALQPSSFTGDFTGDLRNLITGDVAISNAAVKIVSTNADVVPVAPVPVTLTRTQLTGLTGGIVSFASLQNTTFFSTTNPGLAIGLPHYGATNLTISGTPDGVITSINTVNSVPIGPTTITGTNGELWLGQYGSDVNSNSDPRLEFRTASIIIGDGDLDGIQGSILMGDSRSVDFAPGGVSIDNHAGSAAANATFEAGSGGIELEGLAPASIRWKSHLTTTINILGSADSHYTASYVSKGTRLFAGLGSTVDTTTVANGINNLNGLTILGAAAVHVDARSAALTTPIQIIPDPARPAEIADVIFDSTTYNTTYFLDTTNTGMGRIGNSTFSQANPSSFVLYKPENTHLTFLGVTTSPEQYFSEINVIGTPALSTIITPGNLRVNVAATTNPLEINLTSAALLTLGSTGDMRSLLGSIDINAQGTASVPAAIRFNSSADPTPRTVALSQMASNEWSVTGMTAAPQPISGANITFVFDGGAGANTFVGPDIASTWLINGANSGKLNETITFTGMRSVVSGSQNDTILFKPTGSLAGNLDGGAGVDTLYYQNGMLTGADVINLPNRIAPRVAGQALNLESSSSFSALTMTRPADQTRQIGAPITPIPIITAGGFGTKRFTAIGLPNGISIDAQTGVLSGTPLTENQSTFITVTAADDSGSASVSFFWTSQPGLYIVFMFRQTVNVNVPVSIQIQAPYTYGGTLTFSATDLPPGLSINPATGLITGTVASGVEITSPFVSSNVSVTDGTHTASQGFSFDIVKTRVLLNPGLQITPDGLPISLAMQLVNATGTVTWTAFGLPGGVSINSQTGVISGAFPQFSFSRQYSITVQASTPSGSSSVQFTWQTGGGFVPTGIRNRSSVVAEQVFDVISFTNNISFSNITVAVTGLPPGLAHNGYSVTGQLDLFADNGSPYHPIVTYTNHTYNYTYQTSFDWTIMPAVVLDTPAPPSSNPGDIVDLAITVRRDLGNPLIFTANNLPNGLSIDSQTGRITGTMQSLPYGATFTDVSITVSDPIAASSSTVSFRWFVNSTPFILLSNTTIDENSAAGTVLGILSLAEPLTGQFWLSDDYGMFALAPDGITIIVNDPSYLNHEYFPTFNFAVYFQISEEFNASRNFTINITNLEEGTSFELNPMHVPENSPAGTVVGEMTPVNPPDGVTYDLSLQFEEGEDPPFELDGTQIVVAEGAILDYEQIASYSIRVWVSDSLGNNDLKTFTITVTDISEGTTEFALSPSSIAENSPAGTVVGDLLPMNPPDNVTFTLSLVNDAGGRFALNGSQLVVASGTALNYEQNSSHDITIEIEDSLNNISRQTFTVVVANINEVPTAVNLTSVVNTLQEDASTATATRLANIGVTDDAIGVNVLSLSGADERFFRISNNRLFLRVGVKLNFATKPVYNVTIHVDDATLGDSPDASINFTLNLTSTAPTMVTTPTPSQDMTPTIAWSAIPGAVSYDVWITNLSTNTALPTQTVTGTTHTPTSDLGIGRFRVWVRSENAAGVKSRWSTPHTFVINTAVTLNPIVLRQNTPRPTISWQSLPGAVRYEIYVTSPTVSGFLHRDATITGTSWTPSSDLAIGRYRAWVRGFAADGLTAAWSREISMIADVLVVPAPTLISPLHATFDRTPTFTWASVSGATQYVLRVRNANDGTVVVHAAVMAPVTNFTPVTELSSNVYYNWEVRAIGAGGHQSDYSPANRLYIGGRPVIFGPTGTAESSTPTFSWSTVQDASRYILRVDRTDVVQDWLIQKTNLTTNSFTPSTELEAGTYRFWVRAVSSTGEFSTWSIVSNFTVAGIDHDQDQPLVIVPDALIPTVLPAFDGQAAGQPTETNDSSHTIAPTTARPDIANESGELGQDNQLRSGNRIVVASSIKWPGMRSNDMEEFEGSPLFAGEFDDMLIDEVMSSNDVAWSP